MQKDQLLFQKIFNCFRNGRADDASRFHGFRGVFHAVPGLDHDRSGTSRGVSRRQVGKLIPDQERVRNINVQIFRRLKNTPETLTRKRHGRQAVMTRSAERSGSGTPTGRLQNIPGTAVPRNPRLSRTARSTPMRMTR